MKVVILSRSFAKSGDAPLKYLEQHGIEYDLLRNQNPEDIEYISKCIGDADGVITGSDVINEYVLDRCSNLKVISKHGTGLDSIDLELAEKRGIQVTKTPTANSEAVADLAVLMMLNLLRNFEENRIKSTSPDWGNKELSSDLFGKTVGLLGYGNIGAAVARRLTGFDVTILVNDPALSDISLSNARLVNLDELLSNSDIVSLHAPLISSTENIVNKASISKMKDGAILINTSRGGLVSLEDLYQALVSGKLSGAGLDVFPNEPPVNEPILALPNVIATPHIAAHTMGANQRMGIEAVKNVVAVLNKSI